MESGQAHSRTQRSWIKPLLMGSKKERMCSCFSVWWRVGSL